MRASSYPFQELSIPELPGEVWKDIPDTDGHYQISNKGRARRLAHQVTSVTGANIPLQATILCQQARNKSKNAPADSKFRFYLNFSLTSGGKRRHLNTARLVYQLFVEPFDPAGKDLVVLYRDDDPLNVCAENLYLGTLKDKARLAAARAHPHGQDFSVSQYTLEGKLIQTYPSNAAAAEAMQVSRSSIRDAINDRNRFTAAGYVWRKGNAAKVNVKQGKSKSVAAKVPVVSSLPKKISQYNYEGILVRSYGGVNEANRETAISRSSIQRVLKGDYTSAGGYLWAYGDSLRIDLREFKQHPNFKNSALGKYVMEKRQKNLDKLAERNPSSTAGADFKKGKLLVARNLLLDFEFTDEQIARAAELPLDEIQRFRNQLRTGEVS